MLSTEIILHGFELLDGVQIKVCKSSPLSFPVNFEDPPVEVRVLCYQSGETCNYFFASLNVACVWSNREADFFLQKLFVAILIHYALVQRRITAQKWIPKMHRELYIVFSWISCSNGTVPTIHDLSYLFHSAFTEENLIRYREMVWQGIGLFRN